MLFIITTQAKLGLQGHGIRETAFHTLFDGVAGRVDKVIEEFQNENVPGVGDREIFLENTEQSFHVSFIGSCFQLEEILEGLNLDIQ